MREEADVIVNLTKKEPLSLANPMMRKVISEKKVLHRRKEKRSERVSDFFLFSFFPIFFLFRSLQRNSEASEKNLSCIKISRYVHTQKFPHILLRFNWRLRDEQREKIPFCELRCMHLSAGHKKREWINPFFFLSQKKPLFFFSRDYLDFLTRERKNFSLRNTLTVKKFRALSAAQKEVLISLFFSRRSSQLASSSFHSPFNSLAGEENTARKVSLHLWSEAEPQECKERLISRFLMDLEGRARVNMEMKIYPPYVS